MHKRETQACITNTGGEVVAEQRFRTSEKSYLRALNKYDDDVIFEAVGFYRPVARWLDASDMTSTSPTSDASRGPARRPMGRTPAASLRCVGATPCRKRTCRRRRCNARGTWPAVASSRESHRLKTKLKHDVYDRGHFVDENHVETGKGRAWLRTWRPPRYAARSTCGNAWTKRSTRSSGGSTMRRRTCPRRSC